MPAWHVSPVDDQGVQRLGGFDSVELKTIWTALFERYHDHPQVEQIEAYFWITLRSAKQDPARFQLLLEDPDAWLMESLL